MTTTTTGNGYWLVALDGGVFTFGDAQYHGAPPAMSLDLSAVTVTTSNAQVAPAGDAPHYWIFDTTGRALAFGSGVDGLAGAASPSSSVVAAAVR